MCADVFSPEKRSAVMSSIKGKDTRPELTVRSACHRLGYRFRIHRNDLPGKPDLVFPGRRLCLFVHGCFWHQHPNCKYAYKPKSRPEFWLPKLQRNVTRDEVVLRELAHLGWSVAVVWECQTKNPDVLEEDLRAIMGAHPPTKNSPRI